MRRISSVIGGGGLGATVLVAVLMSSATMAGADEPAATDASECLQWKDLADGPWIPTENDSGLPLETVDFPLPISWDDLTADGSSGSIAFNVDPGQFVELGDGPAHTVDVVARPGCEIRALLRVDDGYLVDVHFTPDIDWLSIPGGERPDHHVVELQHLVADGSTEVLATVPYIGLTTEDQLFRVGRWAVYSTGGAYADGGLPATIVVHDLDTAETFTIDPGAWIARSLAVRGDELWFRRNITDVYDAPIEIVRYDLLGRTVVSRDPDAGREFCLIGDRMWKQTDDGSVVGTDLAGSSPPVTAAVHDTWEFACTDKAVYVTENIEGDTYDVEFSNSHIQNGVCTAGWVYEADLLRLDPQTGAVAASWHFETGRSPRPSNPDECSMPRHPRLVGWGDRLAIDQYHLLDDSPGVDAAVDDTSDSTTTGVSTDVSLAPSTDDVAPSPSTAAASSSALSNTEVASAEHASDASRGRVSAAIVAVVVLGAGLAVFSAVSAIRRRRRV